MSSPKLILALSGWAGSGKDTAGAALVEFLGFQRLSFADALKHNTAVQYGLPVECFHDRELKEAAIMQFPVTETEGIPLGASVDSVEYWTPRGLAILEGRTKRLVDPDYWVRLLFTPMFAAEQVGLTLFVLTDWRFPNEVAALRRLNPEYEIVTVRIDRFEETISMDDSETALNNEEFDHVIANHGTEEQFITSVTALAGDLLNERRGIKP